MLVALHHSAAEVRSRSASEPWGFGACELRMVYMLPRKQWACAIWFTAAGVSLSREGQMSMQGSIQHAGTKPEGLDVRMTGEVCFAQALHSARSEPPKTG